MSGEFNPFYDKTHTEDSKQKMSNNHADVTGNNNPFKKSLDDPIKREEHKKRCQAIWDKRDDEWRKKFAEINSKAQAESSHYKNNSYHKHHKSGWFEGKKCGRVFYRSSWELLVCEFLEVCDDVIAFTLEQVVLPYTFEGKTLHTKCDFFIECTSKTILMEVKPHALAKQPKQAAKMNAQKKYAEERDWLYVHFDEVYLNDISLLEENIK